jgi:ribonuclease R
VKPRRGRDGRTAGRGPGLPTGGLPHPDEVIAFLSKEPDADLKTAAKAFGLKPGPQKIAFKKLFRELKDKPRPERAAKDTPEIAAVEIIGRDTDGEMLCALAGSAAEPAPVIMLAPGEGQRTGDVPALGVGERFLAKLIATGPNAFEARVIRRLGAAPERVLGVFRREAKFGRIVPVSKKERMEYIVAFADTLDAEDGELVSGEIIRGRIAGLPQVRIRERIAPMSAPRAVSLISIFAHGLKTVFSEAALAQANDARPAPMDGRADLRPIPLLTIDPADARDHDDAVWAAPDADPTNPGGFRAIVAIADVAYYVTPGSPLDREARQRGNSTYFPDRVVPMLPERLSADLCSLIADADRPVIACHLTINTHGEVFKQRFERAMMRSAASLSYEQAQSAIDGHADAAAAPLLESVLKPLWACYGKMAKARDARSPLDLDVPEHKIRLSEDGKVASIEKRRRLDAHRLIEEFMIQANVAAAEVLEDKRAPLIYRIHDTPSVEKLQALSDFLRTLNIKLNPHAGIKTSQLTGILATAAVGEHKELINEVMLRSQSLAIYDPGNIGHFGLNLRKYAHFTSPIRRYADLVVHRSLIRHLKLGSDGLTDSEITRLKDTAETISACERRSMAAEREANDRYMAAFMSEKIGATFWAKVSGVTRFGLFLKLEDTGADGLIPMRSLGTEFFRHDQKTHSLVGERSQTTYRLGQRIEVVLVEAAPLTGGLRFDLANPPASTGRAARPGFPRTGRRR